jgi:hypothetical protein
MAVVAFGVLFAGVVSSVLAARARPAAGVHPAGLAAGPASSIPDRSRAGGWRPGCRCSRSRCCGRRPRAIRCAGWRSTPAARSRRGCGRTSRMLERRGAGRDRRTTPRSADADANRRRAAAHLLRDAVPPDRAEHRRPGGRPARRRAALAERDRPARRRPSAGPGRPNPVCAVKLGAGRCSMRREPARGRAGPAAL